MTIALIIGAILGISIAINQSKRKRDKWDARRYLAEKYRNDHK